MMDHNLNTDITIEEIAHNLHIDPSHLTRVLKSSIGISPKQYMMQQKLAYAKNLLLNTSASVSEVALSVGYSDQLYFSRIFKKREGMTPTEYRETFF